MGTTWFFDAPTDAAKLKAAMQAVVDSMPALAGRRTKHGVVLSNAGARFSAGDGPGSALEWTGVVAAAGGHVEPPRGIFTDLPLTTSGNPLFTVRVTNFRDGTSAVGSAASPHAATVCKCLNRRLRRGIGRLGNHRRFFHGFFSRPEPARA